VAQRVAVVSRLGICVAASSRDECRPDVRGKLIKGHLPDAEGSPVDHPGQIFFLRKKRTAACHPARPAAGRHTFRTGWQARRELLRKGTGDNSPRADSARQVAFCEKLGVGIQHRETGNADLESEDARGGNSLAWAKVAVRDSGAKRVVDLAMRRRRGAAIDRDHGEQT